MRISYFSNSTIPSRAANSIHVMRMAEAFAEIGHDVTLYAGHGNEDQPDLFAHYGVRESFRLVRLRRPDRPIVKSLIYARQVARHVRQSVPPDLFYGRDPLCLRLAASKSVPVIYESHSGPGTLKRELEKSLFARENFARLVVISQALKETYLVRFPQMKWGDGIVVAHDAARDEQGVPPVPLPEANGGLHVGYVGHLYAGKGAEVVLRLAERFPRHQFHIIGGQDRDIARLKSIAPDVGNLTFHGFLPPGEVAGLRNGMDVLLAPYQSQVQGVGGGEIGRWMSPLKVFESMAAGKALIASDLPVLREVLTHEVNCLLAKPDSLDAWVGALRRFENADLRQSLSQAARREIEERYTWTQRARNVLVGLRLAGESS